MSMPFLERICKHFEGKDLSQYCFVFPTRRAGYIFREYIRKNEKKAIWLPEITGIRDFILKVHPVPVADDIILLLRLYQVLKTHGITEPLEKFLPWGKIILNDFNEIDVNLVDAQLLYRQSYEERQIDQAFALTESELEDIAGFWKLFSQMPLTTLQESFLASWKLLPDVYREFNMLLDEHKITYEGRAYRTTALLAASGDLVLPWKKVVFCGFYALSNAEQLIFEKLSETGNAEIFWDSDSYYHDNPSHEAGLYLRRNPLTNGNFSWKENYFASEQKELYITGVPLRTGQVKWLSQVLSEKIRDPLFQPEKSVIVLPDENMLTALLYSLPEELKAVNITMGYPAKSSMAFTVISCFTEMVRSSVIENGTLVFSKELVLDLISKICPDSLFQSIKQRAEQAGNYIKAADGIKIFPGFEWILAIEENTHELKNIYKRILLSYRSLVSESHMIEFSCCNHLLDELDHFFNLIYPLHSELTIPVAVNLVEEFLQTLKIPFKGEPVKGIQVMGFLETRTLDFDHVFILSVNETLLPAAASGKTYLPYSIRKAFRLPLRTEQDAVYSYHFYRLLQRAQEIHLIYNTEPRSLSGGEISRYILQLSMELNERNNFPVRIHHQSVSTEALMQAAPQIIIYKDENVLNKLRELYIENRNNKGLSVTALSDFVQCPLKFYLKYIAGIRIPEENVEEIDAAMFGKVFHSAVSVVYQDHKVINSGDRETLLAKIDESLRHAIEEEFGRKAESGNDYLLKGVLKDLLRRIVINDCNDAPIELAGHEMIHSHQLNVSSDLRVSLYGIIDRLEMKDNAWRVIDYKTGNDNVTEALVINDLFEKPAKKVMLQLLFYSWMIRQEYPHVPVKAGMYKLRNVNQGVKWLLKGNEISDEIFSEFESRLTSAIENLFNADIPFSQTEDYKRCEYCDFINICGRN